MTDETIEITTPDDRPRTFVAAFQEPSKITVYGLGATPLVAVRDLLENLRSAKSAFNKDRAHLGPQLREELLAIEAFLNTFQETPCRKRK
jgi:hypothetical protein